LSVIGASQAGTCAPMRASGEFAQYFMACSPQHLYVITHYRVYIAHYGTNRKIVFRTGNINNYFVQSTILSAATLWIHIKQ
jgi:hypothetical protein